MTVWFLQFVLLVTFLLSAVGKLVGFEHFKQTIEGLKINRRLVIPGAVIVIVLELAVAALLLFSKTQYVAYVLILVLLGCFSWSIYRAYNRQLVIACNCFGNMNSELFGWNTVFRVVTLLVINLYLLMTGTSISWMDFSVEEFFYALTGSIGALLLYFLLPFAVLGIVVGEDTKQRGIR